MKGQRDTQTIEIKEAQKTINDLEKQISANISELEQEKTQRAAGEDQLKSLAEELAAVKGQRDTQTIEIAGAHKMVDDLKQQVSVKISELEQEKMQRAAGADQLKTLAEELASVKRERDIQAIGKAEAKEKIELTLLQLHQTEEELESIFLATKANKNELEELKQKLSAKTSELEKECSTAAQRYEALQGERDIQAKEKAEAIAETQLTLLQLHQVQEELENYFMQTRHAEQIVVAQQDQLMRAQALITRLLPESALSALIKPIGIEVLPPSPTTTDVQTNSLLRSYSTSLRRASALLQRAIRG